MRTNGSVHHDASLLVPGTNNGILPSVVAPHHHQVQFYDDDSFFLDDLSHVIADALAEGNCGLVIATPIHEAGLAKRLRGVGVDLARVTGEGRYIALDAFDTLKVFMRDGWPDAVRFTTMMEGIFRRAYSAARNPHSRVVAFGEMVALLGADGNIDVAIRLEQLWNDLAQKHSFELHCAYPLSLFYRVEDSQSLLRICSEHSRVVPVESDALRATTDDERQRSIVLLQQKAQALETEVEERKRQQETLERREVELVHTIRESSERAEAAIQARDRFLSIASHELRTPVTALKGSAQLLRRRQARGELDEERLKRTLMVVENSANQLAQLTSDLLDISRIQAGHLALARTVLDFSALVERAIERANDQLEGNHLLQVQLPEERAIVWGDPDRLDQVLTNLLMNAKKYSSAKGSVQIHLRLDTDHGCQLAVRDRGIGLPRGAADIIFEPFGWAPTADMKHVPRIGLGLYISRNIVERHGGRIWAESAGEGLGTTFFVWLPLCPAGTDIPIVQ